MALTLSGCEKPHLPLQGKRIELHAHHPLPQATKPMGRKWLGAAHPRDRQLADAWRHNRWQLMLSVTGLGEYSLVPSPLWQGNVLYAVTSRGAVSMWRHNVSGRSPGLGPRTTVAHMQRQVNLPCEGKLLSVFARMGGGISGDRNRFYVTTPGSICVAYGHELGALLWQKALSSPIQAIVPAINADGTKLLVATVDNQLYCLNSSTGKILWQYTGPTEDTLLVGGGSPVVHGDRVFFASSGGELASLALQDGGVAWVQPVSSARLSADAYSVAHIKSPPLVMGEHVYTVSVNGQLTCMLAQTGEVEWTRPLASMHAMVALGHEALVVATRDDTLVALDPVHGHQFWQVRAPDGTTFASAPVRWGGYVCVLLNDGTVSAWEGATGAWVGRMGQPVKKRWTTQGALTVYHGMLSVSTPDGTISLWAPAL